jgi:hypothetical protein
VAGGEWSGDIHYHRDAEESGWTGKFSLKEAEVPIAGLAHPLSLTTARVQLDGARVQVDRITGTAGKLAFSGDYRYEIGTTHPHRLHLRAETWDSADVEAELMPTMRRNTSLIARTLGRPMVTDWLRSRNVDGTVQIGEFTAGGVHLENFKTHLIWDVAHVQLEAIQAAIDRAALTGKLDVNLRGSRPTYRLTARVKGAKWQSGKLDLEASVQTFGTGTQLLTNATAEGVFTGSGVELGTLELSSVAGNYSFSWWQAGPRLLLSGLTLKTDEETYTGHGSTQDDGRILLLLTNGAREMRMSGTLAKLKVE